MWKTAGRMGSFVEKSHFPAVFVLSWETEMNRNLRAFYSSPARRRLFFSSHSMGVKVPSSLGVKT